MVGGFGHWEWVGRKGHFFLYSFSPEGKASPKNVDNAGTEHFSPEVSFCLLERAILAWAGGDGSAHRLVGRGQRNREESLAISSFLGLGSWWEPPLLFFLFV